MSTIWEDLGQLIDTLPPEEQVRYRAKLQTWVHDLRGKLGVIFSAIGLLERRGGPALQGILEMMRENFKQTLEALEEIRQVYREKE
jgi:signal transduction histidine kinase